MNFSLSQALSKNKTDTTESFRFNLGTTFWWNFYQSFFFLLT
jgi:hypothetical protein